jgi:uncharacterized protein (DUF1778 family)
MRKIKVLQIRLSEQQKKEIDQQAYVEGKTITDYLLEGHQLKMKEKGKCPCCGQDIKKK